jgi:hypothetical protein
MTNLIPIILELDEELSPEEEFKFIKTVLLSDGQIGYVAVIKRNNPNDHLDIRYGNLRAVKHEGKLNNKVL